MTNEIKEIIDGLEKISTPTGISYSGDVTINNDDVKILRDYITNLQEEKERLYKELEKANSITQSYIFEVSRKSGKSYRECLNWLEDYKLRINKAIEYIEEHMR